MPRTGPFIPVFRPEKRRGQVLVGTAIGTPPATPFGIIGRLALANCTGIAMTATHAFVASPDDDTVYSIDITDPTNPTQVDSITDGTTLNGAAWPVIVGSVMYVGCNSGDRVTSMDISDPTNLSVLHSVTNATTLDRPGRPIADGNYLYVPVVNTDRLTVIDKSNPSAMTIAGSVTNGALDGAFSAYKSGNTVIVAPPNEVAIATVDVTTPSSPGSVAAHAHADLNGARAFAVIGTTLYVTAPNGTPGSKLTEMDISTPSTPTYVAATTLTNRPWDIAVVGTNLYTTPAGTSQTLTKSDATTSPPTEGTILDDADLATAAGEVYIATNGSVLGVVCYFTDMLLIVAP